MRATVMYAAGDVRIENLLLGYVRELLDPPMQTRPQALRVETPEPLSDIERTAIR